MTTDNSRDRVAKETMKGFYGANIPSCLEMPMNKRAPYSTDSLEPLSIM
jgi:hypothetical protein